MTARERQRDVIVQEYEVRRRIIFDWSVGADRIVRDPRRLKASGFLLSALGELEACERRRRDAISAFRDDEWRRLHQLAAVEFSTLRGIGAAERFLVQWIRRRRAVRERFARATARLVQRESTCRRDIFTEFVHDAVRLKAALIEADESAGRVRLAQLELRAAVGSATLGLCIADAAWREAILRTSSAADVHVFEMLARGSLRGDERRARAATFASLRTADDSIMLEEAWGRHGIRCREAAAWAERRGLVGRLVQLAARRELEAAESSARWVEFEAVTGLLRREHARVAAARRYEAQCRIARRTRVFLAKLLCDRVRWRRRRLAVERDEQRSREAAITAALVGVLHVAEASESDRRRVAAADEARAVLVIAVDQEAHRRGRLQHWEGLAREAAMGVHALTSAEDSARRAVAADYAWEVWRVLPTIETLDRHVIAGECTRDLDRLIAAIPELRLLAAAAVQRDRAWREWLSLTASPKLQLTPTLEEHRRRDMEDTEESQRRALRGARLRSIGDAQRDQVTREEAECRMAVAAAESAGRERIGGAALWAQLALSAASSPQGGSSRRAAVQRSALAIEREELTARRAIHDEQRAAARLLLEAIS